MQVAGEERVQKFHGCVVIHSSKFMVYTWLSGERERHHPCSLMLRRVHFCNSQGPQSQTLAPAVLPHHVCLHAVLRGEESVAVGHWAAAFRSTHILQVFLRMNVQTASSWEPGTAPWNREENKSYIWGWSRILPNYIKMTWTGKTAQKGGVCSQVWWLEFDFQNSHEDERKKPTLQSYLLTSTYTLWPTVPHVPSHTHNCN